MADSLPHFHVSGLHTTATFLVVVAVFGTLHLLAISAPERRSAQAWLALGF